MITTKNYYSTIEKIGVSNLPKPLKDDYEYVNEVTDHNSTWSFYNQSKDIKATIDQHFADVQSFLNKSKDQASQSKQTPTASREIKKAPAKKPVRSKQVKPPTVHHVERIEEEVKFIKRYALLHGKEKTSQQILGFINSLQKAILEKRIRKASKYSKDIKYIQDALIKLYNVMGDKVQIKVNDKVLNKFLTIGGSEKVRLSITYLKRYIGIQGKTITKDKAQRLAALLEKAVKNNQITKADPYGQRLNKAYESLLQFVKAAKKNDTLQVHETVLNGINEALSGSELGCASKKDCGCNGLNGIDLYEPVNKNTVMSSLEFAKMKFDSLGFTGKWLDLIGDPSKGFTAMVFGKPKMGKSYLCIDFAGYLARNHGKVLYVAREEKLDATLQKKLNDKDVMHPNLFVSDYLPEDLSRYEFVFLDSVNKLGLEPEDLENLKSDNPGVSFIYIFQTTKEGNFRGANSFQHDVDAVIEVPEKGKAVQFGRFNQGAEISIFDSNLA